MPSAPVSPTAKLIAGSYSKPFIVRNEGTVNVYLGQDSSLTVSSRAFTLTPGASLNWGASTELWAITDPGNSGSIEWLYDSDSSFTPGPSNVTVSGEVVALGQKVLITTLSINAGTAATGGTPLSDTETNIDVSSYNSIFISLATTTIPSVATLVDANWIVLDIRFRTIARVDTIASYFPQYMFSRSTLGQSYFHVPVVGPILDISMFISKLVTLDGMIVTLNVYGSNEVIVSPKYGHGVDSSVGDGQEFLIGKGAGSGSSDHYIVSKSGPATNALYSGAVAGKESVLRIINNGARTSILDRVSSKTTTNDEQPHALNFPFNPIVLTATNTGAGGSDHSVTQP